MGKGPGALTFNVGLNDSTLARPARFNIGTATYGISQSAPAFPAVTSSAVNPPRIAAAPYVGVIDTRTAALDGNNPIHTCTQNRDAKSTWLQFTPPGSGAVTVTSRGSSYTTAQNYGIVLAVYARTTTGDIGPELACVAQNPGGPSTYANVKVTPAPGQTFMIQVSGRGADSTGGYTVITVSQ